MTERSDGRLEDVGGTREAVERNRWSKQSWLSTERMAGGRDGSSMIDRYVSTVFQLANVVSNAEGFALSWGIGSSEAHAYRI